MGDECTIYSQAGIGKEICKKSSYIGIRKDDVLKPFSLGEWSIFLDKIIEENLEPKVILNRDVEILKRLNYSSDVIERICKLASRGGAVAFELEEWSYICDCKKLYFRKYGRMFKRGAGVREV